MVKACLCLSLLLCFVCSGQSKAAGQKLIPNEAEYSAFLLNGWRAERPNVLVFKDPFCPYCLKAIPKLELLTDYNVYVFWAPILGPSSQQRVAQIFNCERLASKKVMDAVVLRKQPNCPSSANPNLRHLNDRMVDNYQINAVPSFYLQGKNVSLAGLLKIQNARPAINGVKINWQTFQLMRYSDYYRSKNLVIYIPQAASQDIDQLLTEYQPEYVFLDKAKPNQYKPLLKCDKSDSSCINRRLKEYNNKTQEFKLLMGKAIDEQHILIFNGMGQSIQLKI